MNEGSIGSVGWFLVMEDRRQIDSTDSLTFGDERSKANAEQNIGTDSHELLC